MFFSLFDQNFIKTLKKELIFQKLLYLCTQIKIIIMNKGIVKFFNVSKGFGFIKDADSSKEYFVHSTGLIDKIKENDEVTFDLQEGKKGLNAVNVRLA